MNMGYADMIRAEKFSRQESRHNVMTNNFVKERRGRDVYWEVNFPAFCFSRFLGVSPVNKHFVLSKGYLLLSILFHSFTFLVGLFLLFAMEKTNKMLNMSGFSLILERAQLLIVVSSVVVSVAKSITNISTLYSVMSKLYFLDKKLIEVGLSVPYSRFYGFALSAARVIFIFILFMVDVIVYKSWRNPGFLVVQYILIVPLLVVNFVQVQFMVLLEAIQRRVRVLTQALTEIRGDSLVKPARLHVLVSVHSSLISLCDVINGLYSPQILLILSGIFINITANLYHVIDKMITFMTRNKWDDLNFFAITSYRVFVRSQEVWGLVTTCVNTTEIAKEFTNNLYQVMIDDKSNEVASNRKLRLHVAMDKEVTFTAWRFFTLDYTLVHSMISAATTYLVILIQFGQPTGNEKEAVDMDLNNATALAVH